MAELSFPDPGVTNPWQDPVSKQWWQHDGDGWLRFNPDTPDVYMLGFKNVLINGDFRINQRDYSIAWVDAVDGDYVFDRWFKNVDKKIQKIETENLIEGETYTMSWSDGGQAQFQDSFADSGLKPSPFTFVASVGSTSANVQCDFVCNNIQIERGTVATNFEVRPTGLELVLCQRYYWEFSGIIRSFAYQQTGSNRRANIYWPVTMRITPITNFTTDQGSSTTLTASKYSAVFEGVAPTAESSIAILTVTADAEI